MGEELDLTGTAPTPPAAPPAGQGATRDEGRTGRLLQLALAVALLAVAGYLVATRYAAAATDWYLENLRCDVGDPDARSAFRRMGERAIPRLEHELETAQPEGRLVAVLALACIEGPGAERLLARAATDPDGFTASNSVFACASRRDPLTERAMVSALSDARPMVRLSARNAGRIRLRGIPWWGLGAAAKDKDGV